MTIRALLVAIGILELACAHPDPAISRAAHEARIAACRVRLSAEYQAAAAICDERCDLPDDTEAERCWQRCEIPAAIVFENDLRNCK